MSIKTSHIVDVEITPEVLARAFWEMSSAEQAAFFNALHDVISEDHKTNLSAYSLGEMQWCYLRHELDVAENRRGKLAHMALSCFAFDYLPMRSDA